jgi:hypothetical protein
LPRSRWQTARPRHASFFAPKDNDYDAAQAFVENKEIA